MAELVHICCALISIACAVLLTRSYLRGRSRILLWVALSFAFLALNNIFNLVDLVMFPEMDLWGSIVRNALLGTAGAVLAGGLLWELS